MKSNLFGGFPGSRGIFAERTELTEVSDSGMEVVPNPTGVTGTDIEFVPNLSGVFSGVCGCTGHCGKVRYGICRYTMTRTLTKTRTLI